MTFERAHSRLQCRCAVAVTVGLRQCGLGSALLLDARYHGIPDEWTRAWLWLEAESEVNWKQWRQWQRFEGCAAESAWREHNS